MDKQDIIRKMQEAGLKAPARGEFIFIHWDQIAMLLEYERAAAIRESLAEQPAQQDPVQTTPNSEQLKQILDGLDRCIHRDSTQEFLRTWIRDWTEHKLAKHALSTRHQGETK